MGDNDEKKSHATLSPTDELEELFNGHLSPSRLQSIAQTKDLGAVTHIELKVDTRITSLADLGRSLPALEQLKLNDSFIPSIRDLGVGFGNLRVLWMAKCHLAELDGISSLSALKELYLSYNEISDLSSLSMVDGLEVLDLEGNCVHDFSQLEYLSLCQSLTTLTLEGNPVTESLDGSFAFDGASSTRLQYRLTVWDILPHLRVLDDEELTESERENSSPIPYSTAPLALTSNSSSHGSRPQSRLSINDQDFSSELTCGTTDTIAGNPVLFLRSRRRLGSAVSSIDENKEKAKSKDASIAEKNVEIRAEPASKPSTPSNPSSSTRPIIPHPPTMIRRPEVPIIKSRFIRGKRPNLEETKHVRPSFDASQIGIRRRDIAVLLKPIELSAARQSTTTV
ncbi:Leucine-rich repeat-containing protein 56 [Blyttiomyces sp. JEL0837]|nr:Leucine-rich repeat-containing protein 56 [Blyttiomyces sp. JEL0837]